MEDQAVDYSLQNDIYNLLIERPEWTRYFQEMVAWEEKHPPKAEWDGWEWQAVHCPVSVVNSLISMGMVDLCSKSRTYSHYRLRSLPDTKIALSSLHIQVQNQPVVDVSQLFSLVVGHDKVKTILRYALQAESPIHCLLVGPPGTAKTLLLSDIGQLPGAQFYLGSTTSKSGLVGMLLAYKPPILVIDEFEKADPSDMTPLLNLMESSSVIRLIHGHNDRVELRTKVFAGANDVHRVPQPILSRFAKLDIPPYTPKEFIDVAKKVLIQREGLGPEMALHIASEVMPHSLDIRDAVRVARMAQRDPLKVREIVSCLFTTRRPGPVPLRGEQ
jgi:Holliday junction DNA helicase RuvB